MGEESKVRAQMVPEGDLKAGAHPVQSRVLKNSGLRPRGYGVLHSTHASPGFVALHTQGPPQKWWKWADPNSGGRRVHLFC